MRSGGGACHVRLALELTVHRGEPRGSPFIANFPLNKSRSQDPNLLLQKCWDNADNKTESFIGFQLLTEVTMGRDAVDSDISLPTFRRNVLPWSPLCLFLPVYFSVVKNEAVSFPETLVNFYQTRRRHISSDLIASQAPALLRVFIDVASTAWIQHYGVSFRPSAFMWFFVNLTTLFQLMKTGVMKVSRATLFRLYLI